MLNIAQAIGIWVAVFLTLMVLSFLYKENPFFRLAEYLTVGLSAGYAFAAALRLFINQSITPIIVGNSYGFIIPLALGAMFYFQFSKRYSYLYRFPLSLAIGYGLGVTLWSWMQTYFVEQIKATILPISASDPITTINNLILILGTVLSLSYFLLSREQKGTWGGITRAGKYLILLALGAVFGSTVLGRMALLIQRIQFLVGAAAFPWPALNLGTAEEGRYAPIGILLFVPVFGYYLYRSRRKEREDKIKTSPSPEPLHDR
ncbi:MAG TPA: hypothetical protein VMU35_02010 [Methylomirabilota bacterium]|nr:hypothetical protein [Methylomirabilota bacterium]